MEEALLDRVRNALRSVAAPGTDTDIVSAGIVKGLTAKRGRVGFVVEATDATTPDDLEPVRVAAEAAARAVEGVEHVTAVLTAHASAAAPPPAPGPRVHKHKSSGGGQAPQQRPRPANRSSGRIELPGVDHVIAVASGKGGVGKSTIAVNLACALASQGLRVGLLDADIYGPSAPIMMGLKDAKPTPRADEKLEPPTAYGVKVMSMGFLVDADQAMMWRGPMVMSALGQMLADVAWEPLDALIIDMPPGTGDAQLTLVQRAPLSGAVIVSTPQDVALADVRRGVAMFRATHVPILGVVENMSALTNPETGQVFAPFGAGGAERAAAELEAPFLGAVPVDPTITAGSDAGEPLTAVTPDSEAGKSLSAIAEQVAKRLGDARNRPPPRLIFE